MERLAGVGCHIRKCNGTSLHLLSTQFKLKLKSSKQSSVVVVFMNVTVLGAKNAHFFKVTTVMFDRHVKIIFNGVIELFF